MTEPICPFCERLFRLDSRYGYKEDGVQISTCKDCWGNLMNLWLLQKLRMYKSGDIRKLLREAIRNGELNYTAVS